MTRTTTSASTKLFGLDIAGEVATGIAAAGNIAAAVLVKRTGRERATASLANGTRPTETRYPCRGVKMDVVRSGENVAVVLLLGATIKGTAGARVVPEVGDAIEIGGESLEIGAVKRDAAAAGYLCTAGASAPGSR